MTKFLDDNGLLYFWIKLKSIFVPKVEGKNLSTNDLTNELKTNYDAAYTHSQSSHAPSNAEENVQADWNEVSTDSDAYIKNKPTIPTIVIDNVLSDSSANPVENRVIKSALDVKINSNTRGQPNGVASLDETGVIPSSQLPSFVDDVVELIGFKIDPPVECSIGDHYYNTITKLIYLAIEVNTWGDGTAPEKSKIYVDVSANGMSYRWGGTDMVMITSTDLVTITNSEIDNVIAT